jgi:FHA domain
MDDPTVIIDLSPVVLLGDDSDWRNVERVVKAWREQKDPDAVFYGIADNSLWYKLDDYGQRHLRDWKKRRRARSVPFADLDILELAEAHPGATIITTDLFRDHRRHFPWLQGSTRLMRPVISDSGVTFSQLDFSPIPDYEVSMRSEDARLKPKGITSPEARQQLRYEWSCPDPDCSWGASPVIDDDPAYIDGRVCCPKCLTPAGKAGFRERTREVVVLLGDDAADRIPLAEGTSIVVGRGRGKARYDVRSILADGPSRLVSRDHLRLTNTSGRLHIEELGSRNGTTLIRTGGGESQLQVGVLQVLELTDRISIAKGALQIRASGRKRARGRYAPDLTTAPWLS